MTAPADAALLAGVSQEIHPSCEMYRYACRTLGEQEARSYYLGSSVHLVRRLLEFLEAAGLRPAELSLLDFASGYGRFTRFFVRHFREVFVSDLEPEMLAFAERCFGAPGYLSDTDPARLRIDRRFDVVFCFSLFTHLPEATWTPWLRRLAELVEPGGLLIFTTRSPALAASLQRPVLGGTAVVSVSSPCRPATRRELSLHGLRLSARPGAAGTVRVRIPVTAAAPWWIEAPRLADERPAPGLCVGPATAAPVGGGGAWDALEIRLPFAARTPVADTPLGGLSMALASARADRPVLGAPELHCEARDDGAERRAEFRFEPTNETAGRLDPSCYGSTTVSHAWVCRAAASLGTLELVARFPGGAFDLFQDVYAFRRR